MSLFHRHVWKIDSETVIPGKDLRDVSASGAMALMVLELARDKVVVTMHCEKCGSEKVEVHT